MSKALTQVYEELYTKKTRRSRELWLEHTSFTPYGVHSNWRIFYPHPIYVSKAKGPKIWDVDGNEYIDYNLAFGALVIGHSNPTLVEKLKQRLDEGTIYGHETEWSVKLSKTLTERFRYDMVRFSSTGLEATLLATRLARAATGRNKILKFEGHYHGSHEMLMVSVKPDLKHAGHPREPNPIPSGYPYNVVPKEVANTVIVAQWNDIESVEKIFRKYGNDIAAVILEPVAMNMGVIPPEIDLIRELRKLVDEYNSLLIYDEVKTCGMWYSGAQEHYGVKADIITIGKALGGGLPFSAVLASKDIMELIGPKKVPHGGTFNANPLSIYAAYIVATELLTRENMAYASNLSEELSKGYKELFSDHKINAQVVQIANKGTIYFTEHSIKNWRDFVGKVRWGEWYVWTLGMVTKGVIPQPMAVDEQWTVSIMHTKEDIQKTLEVAEEVLSEVKGKPVQPLQIEEAI